MLENQLGTLPKADESAQVQVPCQLTMLMGQRLAQLVQSPPEQRKLATWVCAKIGHKYTRTHTERHTHTNTKPFTHTHKEMHTQRYTHGDTQTQRYPHTHRGTRTRTRAHTHTHTHSLTHNYAHTHSARLKRHRMVKLPKFGHGHVCLNSLIVGSLATPY